MGALFSIGFVGCSCEGDPPPSSADPRPVYTPETFDFGGLCSGESTRQELTIRNESSGRLEARFFFDGPAAESFRLEREGEPITDLVVAGHRSEIVEIVYEPSGVAGEQEAWLRVETNSKQAPEADIFLTGIFSSNPTAPRLSAAWKLCEDKKLCTSDKEKDPCCFSEAIPGQHEGSVHFGRVGIEQEREIVLALESSGCAPVTITEVEVELDVINSCNLADLMVELPEGGLELPGSVEVARHDLPIVFKPANACVLSGTLTLHTTDPERPTMVFQLRGEGIAGSLVSSPAEPVNFGSVRKGEYAEIEISMINPGTETVEVSSIEILGADAEHFKLVRVQQCGAEVFDLPVEVVSTHSTCKDPNPENCDPGQPPECASRLVLVTWYEPQSGGRHGGPTGLEARYYIEEIGGAVSTVRMLGSSLPTLQPYPWGAIAFGTPLQTHCGDNYACSEGCLNKNPLSTSCVDDTDCPDGHRCIDSICTRTGTADAERVCATTCGTAQRSFQICNEGGANDLVISEMFITDRDGNRGSPRDEYPGSVTFREPIFTLDEGDCLNGPIEPDACCQGSILLLDNHGGGSQSAVLEIHSNSGDPVAIDILKNTTSIVAPTIGEFVAAPAVPRVGSAVTIKADVSATNGGLGRFVWEMIAGPGSSTPLGLPTGFIDPSDPDKVIGHDGSINDCAMRRQGRKCFELLNDDLEPCSHDGSDCSVLRFYPEIHGRYEYGLQVEGTVCDKPLAASQTNSINVEQ